MTADGACLPRNACKVAVRYIQGCEKMHVFLETRADVGMVQCVSKEHGKPPGGKTVPSPISPPAYC